MQRFAFLVVPFLLASSCIVVVHDGMFGSDRLRGSGRRVEVQRTLPDFSGIEFRTAGKVFVTVGGPTAVTLSGDDNLLSKVRTEIRKDQLVIDCPDEVDFDERLRVTIHTPSLEAFRLHGAADVEIEGVKGSVFDLDVHGAGSFRATGAVEKLFVSVTGACDALLGELEAREASISISGAGDIEVAAMNKLHYDINGAGDITYTGDPQITGRVAGSGQVRRR